MAKTITAKKRNPQDLTLRNLHALNKRVTHLETEQWDLKMVVSTLIHAVTVGTRKAKPR